MANTGDPRLWGLYQDSKAAPAFKTATEHYHTSVTGVSTRSKSSEWQYAEGFNLLYIPMIVRASMRAVTEIRSLQAMTMALWTGRSPTSTNLTAWLQAQEFRTSDRLSAHRRMKKN